MQELYDKGYDNLMKDHIQRVGALELQKREMQGYIDQGYVLHHDREFVPLPVFTSEAIVQRTRDTCITRLSSSTYLVVSFNYGMRKYWEVNIDTGIITQVPPRIVDPMNRWDGTPLCDERDEVQFPGSTAVTVDEDARDDYYYMNANGKLVSGVDYHLSNDRRFVVSQKHFQGRDVLLIDEEGVPETKVMLIMPNDSPRSYIKDPFLYRGEWYVQEREIVHPASGGRTVINEMMESSFFRISEISGNILVCGNRRGNVSLLRPTEDFTPLLNRRREGEDMPHLHGDVYRL